MSTDPLFMKIGGQYYWYHNDHLGTPQMMTTSSGAVVWKAKYSSFGKAEVDPSSAVVNLLRLPGQYEDSETGLQCNYFRYYDPKIGRYLRIDPIGFYGGLNLYSYVSNNPMSSFDPWGLWAAWAGGNIAAAFGPWGANQGGGATYDSSNGLGLYSTKGSTEGFAFSGGSEIGFFSGSISGYTNTLTFSAFGISVGFIADFKGNYGAVVGYTLGAPLEGNISDNNTYFDSFADMFRDLRDYALKPKTKYYKVPRDKTVYYKVPKDDCL